MAITYYLLIDGINSGSVEANPAIRGGFEVSAFDFDIDALVSAVSGTGGASVGKATPSPLELDLIMEAGLGQLLSSIVKGAAIKSVQLVGINSALQGSNQTVYDLRLKNAFVTSLHDEQGTDHLSLVYQQVTLETWKVDNKTGQVNPKSSTVGWDVAANSTSVPAITKPNVTSTAKGTEASPEDYYLFIEGLNGGVIAKGFEGAFKVTGHSFDVAAESSFLKGGGAAVGKPTPGELVLDLENMAGGLGSLITNIVQGKSYTAVRLVGATHTGGAQPEVVYDLRLKDAFVTSVHDSAVGDQLSLVFKEVSLTTKPQDNTGKLGAETTVHWNVAKMVQDATPLTAAKPDMGNTGATVNHPPTGTPSAVLPNGTEDTPYIVSAASLLVGFTDADGDTLAVANLAANHASVSDNGNGTWTLTPAADYNGPVALYYDVVDGHSGSLAATQGYTLLAVNDPAVVVSTDVTVQETNSPLVVNGVLSISDVDSPAIFVAQPATGGKYGVFALGADGTWSYKANLAYDYLNVGDSLKDTFQVKASDGTVTSVSVTIAGTADTTTVHLGDAPVNQSGTGGQWAQAWSQTGYTLQHKADHTNGAEAWSAVKLSGVSSQVLTGGDIYAGDLGVSGQSAATSTVKQEIDGKEALRVNLPTAADSVTLKLANLFTHDDGSAFSESGLLRLLDATGHVVVETAFYADATTGAKTITLSAPASFTSLELIAGAYDNAGVFVYGGYSTAAGGFGGAVSTDLSGKVHGSDFLVDSMDFVVTLVGVA